MDGLLQRLRKLKPEAVLALSAGLLLVLVAVQGLRYRAAGRLAEEFGAGLRVQDPAPAAQKADDNEQIKKLAEKGLFGKKPPPRQPQLFGILGDTALMGNDAKSAKPYKVDAKLPDGSKLVELQPNAVVVEQEGNRKTIKLFPSLSDRSGGGSPSPSAPSAPHPGGGPPEPGAPPGAAPVVSGLPPMPQLPADMPPEIRAKIQEARERARAAAGSGTPRRVWIRTKTADEVTMDDSGDDEDVDSE